ncbi:MULTISPECIES: EVE domain-containing protein [unclassified Haematospirillum]|uniref:EVE domain-containing protein n=1 Tax=unclassified Haematospirillum TaxID=2622088 RepID=UPI00143B466A|nr:MULTISPECIES: EVE domain-containing protein [unclassified Haematospirillum]NKD55662.1 EVE domain-containing protein [Haematospirillum sp. H4890]NKD75187.1 EVE domain-containing protein [Haematospirillum sp. H4485]NKD88532.1 EVE domain-containing protein [Haematospirillum sp. 15-248]
MGFWLLKSEPDSWSWDDQVCVGTEPWTGVRNHQAAGFLRAMQAGDMAFFYHSRSQRMIMGLVEVVRTAYPDPTDPTGRFVSVDVAARCALRVPVMLSGLRDDPFFAGMLLLRQPRLSVMPVDPDHWEAICKMGDADLQSWR